MTLVGTTLGQYRLVEEIGAGGMATVYKAYQPTLERYVAVKVLAGQLAKEEAFRLRFFREAKAVASLSHAGILPVHDLGEHQGTVYIVTDLVEGGSLRSRLGTPLEPGVAARIAADVALALDYAHRRGIVHRDVKPGNILLTKEGRPVLADFGIAKVMEDTHYTQTGMSIGTPAYMSPEQARSEEVDGRSDLYSLGIVLYEMLTGSTPFRADTPLGVLHQQVFDPPPLPRGRNPRIPKRLEKVILTALDKDPAKRFRTGHDMARALERAVKLAPSEVLLGSLPEGATVPVERPSTRPPAGRRVAREGRSPARLAWRIARPVLGFLVMLLIVVLVLGTALGLGGAYALGVFAERTIESYGWRLAGFTAYGQEIATDEPAAAQTVQDGLQPYALDVVQDVAFRFEAPDSVMVTARAWGRHLRIEARVGLEDGLMRVWVQRLNGVPLYLVGGIISNGINRGIATMFEQAGFRLDRLEVRPVQIVMQAAREEGAAAVAAGASPSLPVASPTELPPGMLTVINEAGKPITLTIDTREWVVPSDQAVDVYLAVGTYPYQVQVQAAGYKPQDSTVYVGAGQTVLRIAPPVSTPAALPAPTGTPAHTPAPKPKATRPPRPTATPTVQPTRAPSCPQPGARITAPGVAVTVRGQVAVQGTADIPGFDFYKLEVGYGSAPRTWAVVGELHDSPVVDGLLGTWDSTVVRKGAWTVRLVVVDKTGNFKSCQVTVSVAR